VILTNDEVDVNTLASYLEMIVDPTWDDFHANRDSPRLAFLTCVAIFHASDRMGKTKGAIGNVQEKWRKESPRFKLVDVICHHLKHVLSDHEKKDILDYKKNDEQCPGNPPIRWVVGFDKDGDLGDSRYLYPIIRDAVRFVHRKAGTIHPALPET